MSVIEIGLDDEHAAVAELIDRLRAAFPDAEPQGVTDLVHSLYARYDTARIREFVPLLVERSARATLKESQGAITPSS